MIAIVEILDDKSEPVDGLNNKIGLYYDGTQEELMKRIPKCYKFYCWNNDYNGKELLVKVI